MKQTATDCQQNLHMSNDDQTVDASIMRLCVSTLATTIYMLYQLPSVTFKFLFIVGENTYAETNSYIFLYL